VRTLAVLVRSAAAVAALVLGLRLLRQASRHRPPMGLRWFQATLVLMTAALLGVVVLDWTDLAAATRVAFVALCVLAGTMVWEADRARRFAGRPGSAMSPARSAAFVEAVGFTVIALVDGFAIITALDLGAPGWIVATVGVLVVLVARPVVAAVRVRAQARTR
jgi:hypothetical protein